MLINNQLWHARVGLFNNRLNKRNKTIFHLYLSSDLSKRLTCILSLNLRSADQLCNFFLISVVLHCLYIQNFLLMKSGDIESNPEPRKSSTLKFCHWNLNGLAAHKLTKLSLLEGYINVNDIDIIYLSEAFVDSPIPIDDNRLSIPGYSMMKADHPGNTKRGGVCLYYKEHLLIIRGDDIANLQECLVTEITVKNKRCFLTCLYRSPSQSGEQIQSQSSNFNNYRRFQRKMFKVVFF